MKQTKKHTCYFVIRCRMFESGVVYQENLWAECWPTKQNGWTSCNQKRTGKYVEKLLNAHEKELAKKRRKG